MMKIISNIYIIIIFGKYKITLLVQSETTLSIALLILNDEKLQTLQHYNDKHNSSFLNSFTVFHNNLLVDDIKSQESSNLIMPINLTLFCDGQCGPLYFTDY